LAELHLEPGAPGELSASPGPLAAINGLLLRGGEKKGGERGRKGAGAHPPRLVCTTSNLG